MRRATADLTNERISVPMNYAKERKNHDEAHDRDTRRVVGSAARAACSGEGANAAQRRAGTAAPGAAVGQGRQGVSIRDRRGERLADRPLPRALAAPRL